MTTRLEGIAIGLRGIFRLWEREAGEAIAGDADDQEVEVEGYGTVGAEHRPGEHEVTIACDVTPGCLLPLGHKPPCILKRRNE